MAGSAGGVRRGVGVSVGVTVVVVVAVGVSVAVGVTVSLAKKLPPEQAESRIDPSRIGSRYLDIVFMITIGGVYSIWEVMSKRRAGFLSRPPFFGGFPPISRD
jgi:hypothetical protein